MKFLLSTEAATKLLGIAERDGLWAQREVARIRVGLEDIKARVAGRSSKFWNVKYSASGALECHATLKDGTSIWRLCPTHVHCIALLAAMDDTLFVLDVCNRAELASTEQRLRDELSEEDED